MGGGAAMNPLAAFLRKLVGLARYERLKAKDTETQTAIATSVKKSDRAREHARRVLELETESYREKPRS
jgi:hypothetical protein